MKKLLIVLSIVCVSIIAIKPMHASAAETQYFDSANTPFEFFEIVPGVNEIKTTFDINANGIPYLEFWPTNNTWVWANTYSYLSGFQSKITFYDTNNNILDAFYFSSNDIENFLLNEPINIELNQNTTKMQITWITDIDISDGTAVDNYLMYHNQLSVKDGLDTSENALIQALIQDAYDDGWADAVQNMSSAENQTTWAWVTNFFGLFDVIFSTQLLPGISIGLLVAIPLVIAVVLKVFGFSQGKG